MKRGATRQLALRIVIAVMGTLVWATAGGAQPFPGGLPQCQADLVACEAATCGNVVAEFGEACDGENLQGASCVTEGFLYGELACSGSCELDTSGCTNDRFVDNGNTITDNGTGLTWEKKLADDGSEGGNCDHVDQANHDARCVNNTYMWSDTNVETRPNGTVFTDFLGELNNCSLSVDGLTATDGFAGHCDWRLPTIAELETILLPGAPSSCPPFPGPCIDPIFGPTEGIAGSYWSSTRVIAAPLSVWVVWFGNAFTFGEVKVAPIFARAVRTHH